ncbi:hypothetical protein OROMI_005042 [Orobanche minor]
MSRLLLVFVAVIIVALHASNLVGGIPPKDFCYCISTMSNLVKLEFNALDISGNNFMPWTLDIKAHMRSMNLTETLNEPNDSSGVDRPKSLIFIRRHLYNSLKDVYITVEDPKELWKNLIDRYCHQKIEVVVVTVDMVEVAITRHISPAITFTRKSNMVGTMKAPLKREKKLIPRRAPRALVSDVEIKGIDQEFTESHSTCANFTGSP